MSPAFVNLFYNNTKEEGILATEVISCASFYPKIWMATLYKLRI